MDLDLKNSAEEWAWVASELLNVNVGMWIVAGLWFVVCGRVPKFGPGIFQNLIIFNSFKFSNF